MQPSKIAWCRGSRILCSVPEPACAVLCLSIDGTAQQSPGQLWPVLAVFLPSLSNKVASCLSDSLEWPDGERTPPLLLGLSPSCRYVRIQLMRAKAESNRLARWKDLVGEHRRWPRVDLLMQFAGAVLQGAHPFDTICRKRRGHEQNTSIRRTTATPH